MTGDGRQMLRWQSVLRADQHRPFLSSFEKLCVMRELCAFGDAHACRQFDAAFRRLQKLAGEENNGVAKSWLERLGGDGRS